MIILIDGWSGSGHSVLRGLLDGHPNLFCSPVHDFIPVAFFEDWEDPVWYEYKDIEQLRRILAAKSGYYRIEKYANNKRFHIDYAKEQRGYLTFDFDFHEFDKKWSQKIFEYDQWHPELLCETIYKSMLDTIKNYQISKDDIRGFVALGEPNVEDPTKFCTFFPHGKLIYMQRSPEGLIATFTTRVEIPEEFHTRNRQYLTPSGVINQGMVQRILRKDDLVREFARKNPQRAMIVTFDEIIENTENVMPRVADFLNIPLTDSLTYFSVLGEKKLTGSGKNYIGKILDRPEDLLSEKDLLAIRLKKGSLNTYLSEIISHPALAMKFISKEIVKLFLRTARVPLVIMRRLFNLK
jgi:Sulfotransferase family